MVSPVHVQTMARYKQWVNQKLWAVCARVSDADRGLAHCLLTLCGVDPGDMDLPFMLAD